MDPTNWRYSWNFGNDFEFKLPTIFHGESANLSLLVKSSSLVVHRSYLGIVYDCKALFFVIIKKKETHPFECAWSGQSVALPNPLNVVASPLSSCLHKKEK